MVEEKKILKLRLSLKGRPVRNYVFDKGVVTIGRNPESDVILDNAGISREHVRIEVTPDGHFQALDLGSANGTLLNDKPLSRAYLTHQDVIQIGKFALAVAIENDRRGDDPMVRRDRDASQFDNTTVMSTEELKYLMARAREEDSTDTAEVERPSRPWEGESISHPPSTARANMITAILIAFLLGTAAGAGTVRLLMH